MCDDCLDRRFIHAVKQSLREGSKAKSGLAFLEAEFLKHHHSYDKIDKIIAPSEFMKNKLDEQRICRQYRGHAELPDHQPDGYGA